jgi:hypothetical protein
MNRYRVVSAMALLVFALGPILLFPKLAFAAGKPSFTSCVWVGLHTRACYPPSQVRAAESVFPRPPVNPQQAVTSTTGLHPRGVQFDGGSMGIAVIDYWFGRVPGKPPYIGIPYPTPTRPKFVDVEEAVVTVPFTHPKIYRQGGAWHYDGNLPPRRGLSVAIVTNLNKSVTTRIGTLIQKAARQGK